MHDIDVKSFLKHIKKGKKIKVKTFGIFVSHTIDGKYEIPRVITHNMKLFNEMVVDESIDLTDELKKEMVEVLKWKINHMQLSLHRDLTLLYEYMVKEGLI